jgi:cytochrome b pre-mRNA-processing protein 3
MSVAGWGVSRRAPRCQRVVNGAVMAFFGLLGRGRYERTGFELYTASVTAARNPYFYAELGVPDTLDGRFDLVGLHAAMVIRRLRSLPPPGAAIAQAVFDAMFSDMDMNLRELGAGDVTIARNVRAMWEAFHGRATVYEAALEAPDPAELEQSLARNIWRGAAAGEEPATLARIVRGLVAQLEAAPASELFAGRFRFTAPVTA